MKINFQTNIDIEVENCNFKNITASFLVALKPIFELYVGKVLLLFFQQYYHSGKLGQIIDRKIIKLKTTNKRTKFKTLFGTIWIPQIQVRTFDLDGKEHQMSITRTLLGVSPKYQIPDFMKELMGWISSVSTFRVGYNIMSTLTGFSFSLTSMWNSVKWSAKK